MLSRWIYFFIVFGCKYNKPYHIKLISLSQQTLFLYWFWSGFNWNLDWTLTPLILLNLTNHVQRKLNFLKILTSLIILLNILIIQTLYQVIDNSYINYWFIKVFMRLDIICIHIQNKHIKHCQLSLLFFESSRASFNLL